MNLIKFEKVTKLLKKREIVHQIDFEINQNEVIALVGTNGAGKTTTIRMLLGITQPEAGSITRWASDFNKKIGVQLQSTPFFEGYTVLENLKLFRTFYDAALSNQELTGILESYNLHDASETVATNLSLGQQKRLALAITTLHNPELIILDEPSAGLDPGGQREVQQMIKQLKKAGKTILFSSHDMLEVRNIADRVIIMDKGRILADGAPGKLLAEYQVLDLEELFYLVTAKEKAYV
ncbi:ABC transporter ATP-binding protein [Enterococcus sp. 669A]|uniref:ABC transporter ATP-binding protein n=1 Tax=Candidatus Enterococcus moelleringii TaxID=2815325 RepID=A0ABS3LEN9_9ENTE|nr:ABC transporter ATP-binding protein [Enterococcus sp. 669A]MBO1308111.1 ABC transporter ATP-binding protein [Enterococcus sp. 669A]